MRKIKFKQILVTAPLNLSTLQNVITIENIFTASFQVSFFMTSTTGRRKRGITTEPRTNFQVYYDVALASGGQAIEVSKSSLSQATDIIVDTSTSVLVHCLILSFKLRAQVEKYSVPLIIPSFLIIKY